MLTNTFCANTLLTAGIRSFFHPDTNFLGCGKKKQFFFSFCKIARIFPPNIDQKKEWVVSTSPKRTRASSYSSADAGAYHTGGRGGRGFHRERDGGSIGRGGGGGGGGGERASSGRYNGPPVSPSSGRGGIGGGGGRGHGALSRTTSYQQHDKPGASMGQHGKRPGVQRHYSQSAASDRHHKQGKESTMKGNGSNKKLSLSQHGHNSLHNPRNIMHRSSPGPLTPTRRKVISPQRSLTNTPTRQAPGRNKSKRSYHLDLEIHLLTVTGAGPPPEQSVIRVPMEVLLNRRLQFVEAPEVGFTPHERCHWVDHDRVERIRHDMNMIFDYKPLEINDETRWKSKVMRPPTETVQNETDAELEKLRQATAILNKLSWTTLEKLTAKFLGALEGTVSPLPSNDESTSHNTFDTNHELSTNLLHESMLLVVNKAMLEPHFAELYACFSAKLADSHPLYRKVLLQLCQKKYAEVEKEEQQYDSRLGGVADADRASVAKKRSIGLMRYIGELYKNKLLQGHIMIDCLKQLLRPDDEEKLECYAQLMTTIGARLHETLEKKDESSRKDTRTREEVQELWRQTYSMAGRSLPPELERHHLQLDLPRAPSNRLKFILQDLIDLKQNKWVTKTRHQQDKAKTIAEIHDEFNNNGQQTERPFPKRDNNNCNRSIPTKSPVSNRVDSRGRNPPKKQDLRRAKSDSVSSLQQSLQRSSIDASSPQRRVSREAILAIPAAPLQSPIDAQVTRKTVDHLSPTECGERMTSILKEYFAGGDLNDAVHSVDELVGNRDEGHMKRGAAVVEAGILLVLEMKRSEVEQFEVLVSHCLEEAKIDRECLAQGLHDPLEFLRDIEIDAPHAGTYLATLLAAWIVCGNKDDPLSLASILLNHNALPERAAEFAIQVLSLVDCAVTDHEIHVVQSLLSREGEAERSIDEIRSWIALGK